MICTFTCIGNKYKGYTDFEKTVLYILLILGAGDSESGNFGSYVLNLEDGRKGGRCSVCGKEFSDRSSARKHVENIHFPGSFNYSCKFCGETFTKKNMMYMHISKFHKK